MYPFLCDNSHYVKIIVATINPIGDRITAFLNFLGSTTYQDAPAPLIDNFTKTVHSFASYTFHRLQYHLIVSCGDSCWEGAVLIE